MKDTHRLGYYGHPSGINLTNTSTVGTALAVPSIDDMCAMMNKAEKLNESVAHSILIRQQDLSTLIENDDIQKAESNQASSAMSRLLGIPIIYDEQLPAHILMRVIDAKGKILHTIFK